MDRFEAALPVLLEEHRGRWVVFREGQVVSLHDDEQSAYGDGIRRFGSDGGQVVARVEEIRVVPLTAMIDFVARADG